MGVTLVKLGPRPALHLWIRDSAAQIEDYVVDWTARLAPGDTIASSTFSLPPGLLATKSSFDAATTNVWISGGVDGERYEVVNRVATAGGRTMDQVVRLRVRGR
jgi:hypothetical protein